MSLVKARRVRSKGYLARREEEVHGAGVPVVGRSGMANPRGDGVWPGAAGGGEGDASSLSLRWRRWGFLIAGENMFGGAGAAIGLRALSTRHRLTFSDQPASRSRRALRWTRVLLEFLFCECLFSNFAICPGNGSYEN